MPIHVNSSVASDIPTEPTKVDAPAAAYWSLVSGLVSFSLIVLGLCRFSLILWPAHPMIALAFCVALWAIIESKKGKFPERRARKIPKFVPFLFQGVGFFLVWAIISSQFDHSFDKATLIIGLLATLPFSYFLMYRNRIESAPFDSIPTLHS